MPSWEYNVRLVDSVSGDVVEGDPDFPSGKLTVNRHHLFVGLIKTILRPSASAKWRRAISQIADLLVDAVLESSATGLYLDPHYEEALRDFSGTSRKGELAQALAYAYFAPHTPFKIFVDYDDIAAHAVFSSSLTRPPGGPDFLVVDPVEVDNYICLECKGTSSHASVAFAEGIRQALKGDFFLYDALGIHARHIFSAVAEWKYSAAGFGETVLHLKDPSAKGLLEGNLRTKLLRMGYANWFEFAENSDCEGLHMGNAPTVKLSRKESWVKIGENSRFECYVASPILRNLQFDGKVLDHASGTISLRNFFNPKNNVSEMRGLSGGDDLEILPDGTAFRVKGTRRLKRT